MQSPTMRVRVAQRHTEAEGIVSFEFRSLDGSALPSFEAGAHIDVYVPGGLTRQYSLCSPSVNRRRIRPLELTVANPCRK